MIFQYSCLNAGYEPSDTAFRSEPQKIKKWRLKCFRISSSVCPGHHPRQPLLVAWLDEFFFYHGVGKKSFHQLRFHPAIKSVEKIHLSTFGVDGRAVWAWNFLGVWVKLGSVGFFLRYELFILWILQLAYTDWKFSNVFCWWRWGMAFLYILYRIFHLTCLNTVVSCGC